MPENRLPNLTAYPAVQRFQVLRRVNFRVRHFARKKLVFMGAQQTRPPNPPHAATTASAAHLVRAYHQTYGLPVTISNCSNNYGPYQFPEKPIPLFLINALHGKPLPIYGDGLQVRDWLHAADHCRGVELAIERGAPGETYNLGGANERPNLETIETLCVLVDEAFAADPSLGEWFPAAPGAHGGPRGGRAGNTVRGRCIHPRLQSPRRKCPPLRWASSDNETTVPRSRPRRRRARGQPSAP